MGFAFSTRTRWTRLVVVATAGLLVASCGGETPASPKGQPHASVDCDSMSASLRVLGQDYNPMALKVPLDRQFVGPALKATRCITDDLVVQDESPSSSVDHPEVRKIKGMPAKWVLFDTERSDGQGVYLNAKWKTPFDGTPKKLQLLFMTGH